LEALRSRSGSPMGDRQVWWTMNRPGESFRMVALAAPRRTAWHFELRMK
jgi:hypothetical protein